MERNSSRFRRLRHSTSRAPLGASSPENSIKKKRPTSIGSWVLQNKAAMAAGLTAAAGAVWAAVVLVWPSLILPMFDPGRVDIAIKVDEAGRNELMSSQEIQIEIKNSSSTRVYLPYLRSEFDVRGRFYIDPEATTTIQFSRFSGIAHLLEPGASLKLSRVAFR